MNFKFLRIGFLFLFVFGVVGIGNSQLFNKSKKNSNVGGDDYCNCSDQVCFYLDFSLGLNADYDEFGSVTNVELPCDLMILVEYDGTQDLIDLDEVAIEHYAVENEKTGEIDEGFQATIFCLIKDCLDPDKFNYDISFGLGCFEESSQELELLEYCNLGNDLLNIFPPENVSSTTCPLMQNFNDETCCPCEINYEDEGEGTVGTGESPTGNSIGNGRNKQIAQSNEYLVFNMSGQLVMKIVAKNSKEIEKKILNSNLKFGIYMIAYTNSTGIMHCGKILKY